MNKEIVDAMLTAMIQSGEGVSDLLFVAIKQPEIVSLWAKQGAVPMSMTTAEFDSYLRGDIVKWAGVVKRIGEKTQ